MNADMRGPLYAIMRMSLPLIALVLMAAPGRAIEALDKIDTPFRDPLLVSPEALTKGVPLPGDRSPAACPAVVDFRRPLDLVTAVDLALCNNAQIKVAWSSIKMQAANKGAARGAYYPTVSASISRREDSTRYPGSSIDSQTIDASPISGSIVWRLFDFGGRSATLTAADQALLAALASHQATLQQILAKVIQAYFDVQVATADWDARVEDERIARQTLGVAQRREFRGEGAASDTLQAATALEQATLQKNRAGGALDKAKAVLTYEMGTTPPARPLVLARDTSAATSGSTTNTIRGLQQWLHVAARQHPALQAARAELRGAGAQVQATRSEGLPKVDLSASYYKNGRLDQSASTIDTEETVLALTLTIPIFDGFTHSYKVRAAEAQVERKAAELQESEHQVLMEVVKAHSDAVSALGNLGASARLLTAAAKALHSVQRTYEQGAGDILAVLNAQKALTNARQEQIRCQAEWRSARLRLLASVGLLGHQAMNL